MLGGIKSVGANSGIANPAIQAQKKPATAAANGTSAKLAAPAAQTAARKVETRNTTRPAIKEANAQQPAVYAKRPQRQAPQGVGNRLDVKA